MARGGIRTMSSYLDPSMAHNLLSVADNTGEELIFEDPGCAAGTDSVDPPSGKDPVFFVWNTSIPAYCDVVLAICARTFKKRNNSCLCDFLRKFKH